MLVPATTAEPCSTRLIIDVGDRDRLPVVAWVGTAGPDHTAPAGPSGLRGGRRGSPMLVEHSSGTFERPGIRGHRLAAATTAQPAEGEDPRRMVGGRSWSTAFVPSAITTTEGGLVVEAEDARAGLTLRTELEALPGGALRGRHTLTNTASSPYLLEALEFTVPLSPLSGEILDN